VTADGMVSGTSANGVANTVANSVLPADDEPSLRRWLFAAVAVVLVMRRLSFGSCSFAISGRPESLRQRL